MGSLSFSSMKTLADQAKYIQLYGILPQHDPSIRFSLFDKYIYYETVYKSLFINYYGSADPRTLDKNRQPELFEAVEQVKDVSSPEELGILAALCPSRAEDIFYAAWFSGYKHSGYFRNGKIFTALHGFCARDPDAAANAVQDQDFPELVRLTFTEGYFDPNEGLF